MNPRRSARAPAKRARRRHHRQHLRGDGGSRAPVAPGHPQGAPRETPGAKNHRHRLRGADRAANLCRHGRSRSRARQCGEARRALYADFDLGDRARARQRHHVGARDRGADSSTVSTAARAPSCRCRTAATIAAPSASSLMAAGNSRSVPMGAVVEEARRLIENGFAEIVLTGVDLTAYGADLPGAPTLGQLVRKILKLVPALKRLRLSSIDSIEADPEADARHRRRRTADAAFPSFRAVGRRHDPQAHEAPPRARRHDRVLRNGAALRPDAAFGADLIAGFPTETEAMFEKYAGAGGRRRAFHAARLSRSARATARPPRACRNLAGSRSKERAARLRAKGEHARWRCAQRLDRHDTDPAGEKVGMAARHVSAPAQFDRRCAPAASCAHHGASPAAGGNALIAA